VNKNKLTKKAIMLVCLISVLSLLFTSCDGDELVYYEPEETTAEPIETEDPGPVYGELLIGSTYSVLPLTAMTQAALYNISYSEAEMYTDCGTHTEVYSAMQYGNIDFALMPYDSSAEQSDFTALPVAKQALVFYVPSTSPIKSLTSEQLRGIYSGRFIGWDELSGSKNQITPIQRGESTAAHELLSLFVGEELIEENVSLATGRAETFDFSEGDIGCAVYTSELFMYDTDIRLIEVDGVLPSNETVANGTYPLMFDICALYESTNEAAREAAEWLTTEKGQEIAAFSGYIPLDTAYSGYRYSIQLYNAVGTSETVYSDTVAQYYYTIDENIISVGEDGKYAVNGLKNTELAAEIGTFINDSVKELSEYEALFNEFCLLRGESGGIVVETECVNGYLSVVVRMRYAGDVCEHSYKYRCRTYDLYTGAAMELSDMFCKDVDFSSRLHRSLISQAAQPFDNWDSVKLLKRELSGLPNSFGFSISEIFFDIDNPFFYHGEIFSLEDVSDMMVTREARSMEDIWEDGYAVKHFRKYTPDGCDPVAVYETIVRDGHETVENLVYFHLSASKLGLDGNVCDNINNAMYAFLKNEMSPLAVEAKIAETGASINSFYYVDMKWIPTFYGTRFVCFTTDGTVEYVNSKYEYATFDDFVRCMYFSLDTGEYLTPDHLFTEGWSDEAVWYGYDADGNKTLLEGGLNDLVQAENEDEAVDEQPENEAETDTALTAVTADIGYPLLVTDVEITSDETLGEIFKVTMKERTDARFDEVTVSVPAKYINWEQQ